MPPFLECSTRGDRRFSAFCARVRGYNGKTIEEVYQAAKIFPDGSTGLNWRKAKGRAPVNAVDVCLLYKRLWREYIGQNPALLDVLKNASGLSDMFGKPGRMCQAHELWEIREEAIALEKEGKEWKP
jgi:hypothetical protein